jgi:hypothetical protein
MKMFTIIFFAMSLLLFCNVKAEECESLKIHSYENLKKLQNCTVIYGNLSLIIFDDENEPEEVYNRTFPLR